MNKDHPEVENYKNIKSTMNSEETDTSKSSSAKESNTPVDDSANPGNKYMSKNRKPKEMEKNGFNKNPKNK